MATAFWNAFGCSLQPILRFADKFKVTGKIKPRVAVLPVPHSPIEASRTLEVDEHLQRLQSHKQDWVNVDTQQRAQLLTECLKNAMAMAEELATTGTAAKGSYEGGIGDEM